MVEQIFSHWNRIPFNNFFNPAKVFYSLSIFSKGAKPHTNSKLVFSQYSVCFRCMGLRNFHYQASRTVVFKMGRDPEGSWTIFAGSRVDILCARQKHLLYSSFRNNGSRYKKKVEDRCFRAGVSKLFCSRATWAITQQFEGRTSYAMWLFPHMLTFTKSTNFSEIYYFFNIDKIALQPGWNGFAGRIWPSGRSLETPVLEVQKAPEWFVQTNVSKLIFFLCRTSFSDSFFKEI